MRRVALRLTTALLMSTAGPSYGANITVNGTTVTISGGIQPGDFEAFKAAVFGKANATIILQSRGGNLGAALPIGDLISERHYATHVPELCTSACGLIFLAGEPRSKRPQAAVGFHQAAEVAGGKPSSVGYVFVEAYLLRHGYSREVVQFVNSANPSQMAYLSAAEIKRLNIDVQIAEHPSLAEKQIKPAVTVKYSNLEPATAPKPILVPVNHPSVPDALLPWPDNAGDGKEALTEALKVVKRYREKAGL